MDLNCNICWFLHQSEVSENEDRKKGIELPLAVMVSYRQDLSTTNFSHRTALVTTGTWANIGKAFNKLISDELTNFTSSSTQH